MAHFDVLDLVSKEPAVLGGFDYPEYLMALLVFDPFARKDAPPCWKEPHV